MPDLLIKQELDTLVAKRICIKQKYDSAIKSLDAQIEEKREIYHELRPHLETLVRITEDCFDSRWKASNALQHGEFKDSGDYATIKKELTNAICMLYDMQIDTEVHEDAEILQEFVDDEYAALKSLLKEMTKLKYPEHLFSKKRKRKRSNRWGPPVCKRRRQKQ